MGETVEVGLEGSSMAWVGAVSLPSSACRAIERSSSSEECPSSSSASAGTLSCDSTVPLRLIVCDDVISLLARKAPVADAFGSGEVGKANASGRPDMISMDSRRVATERFRVCREGRRACAEGGGRGEAAGEVSNIEGDLGICSELLRAIILLDDVFCICDD